MLKKECYVGVEATMILGITITVFSLVDAATAAITIVDIP